MDIPLNKALHNAKRLKNDEFYTRLQDIETGLACYRDSFRDRAVYCNCDNPAVSQFWKYFHDNFNDLGLRKLVATYYGTGRTYAHIVKRKSTSCEYKRIPIVGNGDFRSAACTNILKDTDIVVTNPPFSLFREHVIHTIGYDKDIITLGPIYACISSRLFPLIQHGVLRVNTLSCPKWFRVPSDSSLMDSRDSKAIDGDNYVRMGNIVWYSTVDHPVRSIQLAERPYGSGYTEYDNMKAIHIEKLKQIPRDYDGVMGVPVTFLGYHNPNTHSILGMRYGDDGKDLKIKGKALFGRLLIRRNS